MSKMWEVDPETRSKLQAIQKTNENNRCVDCGAPSPQWASPKFGIFFCLSCSGIHRSLGVHISFVRSITMDSFKVSEVQRMDKGGNKPWKDFFDAHQSNKVEGRTFEDCTIQERYDSDAGEEWKERLAAIVEGREYVPGTKSSGMAKRAKPAGEVMSGMGSGGSHTPTGGPGSPARTASPRGGANMSQKSQNEAYFSRMGSENANRRDDVPPSQGGKFAGFGSEPMPTRGSGQGGLADEIQKDPVAALTKGFGWLGSTVSKQANAGFNGWVKPNVQKFAEGDFAQQARLAAAQVGQNLQNGTRAAADNLSRFVEGDERSSPRKGGAPEPEKKDFWENFGEAPKGPSADKKDFWDSFAAAGEAAQKPATSIGTSAMKKPAGGEGGNKKNEDSTTWGDW